MPRKWENSKGINVFTERSNQKTINYLKREIGLQDKKDYKKPYKPKTKKGGK